MYRASLYHLSLHCAVTDYSIYQDLSISYKANNSMFAISMAEDFALRGYCRVMWPGLVLDEAYANYLCSLRALELSSDASLPDLVAANLLSYQMTGKPLTPVKVEDLDREIEIVHASLTKLSSEAAKVYQSQGKKRGDLEKSLSKMKVAAAEAVAKLFEDRSLYLSNVHSLPYTDSHGKNSLFGESVIAPDPAKRATVMQDAFSELSITLPGNQVRANDAMLQQEGNAALGDWEYSLMQKERLVSLYKALDPKTHFQEFAFPVEDYAEFVRARARVSGPIRRVLDQLRLTKNIEDEVDMKESGQVDIPLAIQVVASKSDRRDVFVQEEVEKKSEAWAILIDSSKSLESLKGQVRDLAVCLSEVARDLIPDQSSWAVYSFNEKMYIVKDFAEIYGNQAKSRIGGLGNGVGTFLPDAIRIVSKRLAKNTAELKVLLVASDGFPLGYEGIDKELVQAIEVARRGGIQLIGLGIGSSAISKYFRSNCVIESPFDLMNYFVKSYVDLTATA